MQMRGTASDLLLPETAAEMAQRGPGATLVEVDGTDLAQVGGPENTSVMAASLDWHPDGESWHPGGRGARSTKKATGPARGPVGRYDYAAWLSRKSAFSSNRTLRRSMIGWRA